MTAGRPGRRGPGGGGESGALRVVLIAEEAAGTRVLKLLDKAESVAIEAVFASPERAGEMGSVWATAERMGVPLEPAKAVKTPDAAAELAGRDIDLVLNVHSLFIVHPSLLELPRLGAYNLHPGPLPEMAGLNVPSWAILLGHEEHAVTLHRMTASIDEGTVAYEDRFPVAPDATGLSLSLECVRRGVPLVTRLLETALAGEPIPARPQDLSRRRYFDRRAPNGGAIDFAQPGARVEAHVRAANYRPFPSPWGHPRVRAEQGVIELVETPVVEPEAASDARTALPPPGTVRHGDGHAMVACADGWVRLETVLFDGAPRQAISFIRDGEALAHL